jgi:hypothetical protein
VKVITSGGDQIELGTLETTPTISMLDYSRRVTDDFGVTTVVERGFSRRLSLRFSLATADVDETQRQLADLRATSVQWVADDRFEWLNVVGFYKDFELDFQTETLTYCTLTIEGLAESEAGADNGSDPAPSGTVSTMRLLQPMVVTDATLVSSNVAEADYPVWNNSTGYAAGTRVISLATHRIYESTVNVSFGQDPTSTTGSWIDVGPTNRWAMFDQALGSLTSNSSPITVVLDGTSVNAVALLDVTAATVRVQADAYDRTLDVDDGAVSFLDLPLTTGHVTVTIAGSGTVSVGTLLVGRLVALGLTEATPTAGINDYSKKETDDFGVVTVVPRSWAKKMGVRALIDTNALDLVANRIAAVRALPSLWIADAGTDSLTIYGFFKDFSIQVGDEVSTLSLSVEGLSEAAPVSGGLADLADSLRAKVQWSSDGLGGSGASAWHDTYVDGQDYFMRQSTDNGVSWGPALRAVGVSTAQVLLYKRSATAPALPSTASTYTFATGLLTGQNNGWSQAPPAANGNPLYVTTATAAGGGASVSVPAASWSAPVVFTQDGADGSNGRSTAQVFLYQRAASAPAVPSVTTTYTFATAVLSGADNGWSQSVPAVNGQPLWVTAASASSTGSTDSIAANEWAGPVIMAQDGSGSNGLNSATVYLYQRKATAPSVPSVNTTYTFASGALTGINNGWSQTIPAVVAGQSLWITQATALGSGSTDSITPAEWATPQILAQDGTNGLSTAQVLLYQRAASAPAVPSAATTYTFATNTLTGVNNGWSQSVPATNGQPLWVTAASASGTGATDTIAANEWASPVIMAQDGAGGTGSNGLNSATVYLYQRSATAPAVPSVTTTYTFTTGILAGTNNGWSQSAPSSNGQPLWVTLATALSASSTDTIGAGEWAAPAVMARDGQDALSVVPAPSSITLARNSDGSLKSGQLPLAINHTCTVGTTTVSPTSITITGTTNCTASNSTSQVFLNSVTADSGSVKYTLTANGQTVSIEVPFSVAQDGVTQTANTLGIDTPAVTWTSYQAHGSPLTTNPSATGKLSVNLTGTYDFDGGEDTVQSKLQYKASSGSTWTDVSGSENVSSASGTVIINETTGTTKKVKAVIQSAGPYLLTGLSTSDSVDLRVMDRRASGSDSGVPDIRLYAEPVT